MSDMNRQVCERCSYSSRAPGDDLCHGCAEKGKNPIRSWAQWTREDWDNATFCEVCGLPLLMVPAEDGQTGFHHCAYCHLENESFLNMREAKQRIQKIYEIASMGNSAGFRESCCAALAKEALRYLS